MFIKHLWVCFSGVCPLTFSRVVYDCSFHLWDCGTWSVAFRSSGFPRWETDCTQMKPWTGDCSTGHNTHQMTVWVNCSGTVNTTAFVIDCPRTSSGEVIRHIDRRQAEWINANGHLESVRWLSANQLCTGSF